MRRVGQLLLSLFPTASIGAYLATMAALATLPLVLFLAFLLVELERSQFQALRVRVAQDAQAISRTVERKIFDMETTLALVANAPELQQGDLAAFHARVGGSLRQSSLFVILARGDGTIELNTRIAYGSPKRRMANVSSVQSALRSGKVELSGVFFGATSKRWVVNLTRPLEQQRPQGVDAVVLTQDAASLGNLVSEETLPQGWSSALIDQQGKVVVSGGKDRRNSGSQIETSWREMMYGRNSSAVFYRGGEQYLLGYANVADWPWKVAVWGPVASVQSPFVAIWKSLVVGSLVFLGFSFCVVFVAAQQLRSAIRRIAIMAERIGKGEIVSPEPTKIVEANQVAIALSDASFNRAQAEERIHFILQELVHRTKNILSLVQAMMRQLARGTDSVDEFQRAVSARLAGLAQSIEALAREQWGGIPLASLVDLQLMTVAGSCDRVARLGPDLLVNANAVQNLGLVFHELATNSVKYGALSVLEGRIKVAWSIETDQQATENLCLTWYEFHGPQVKKPTRKGFGTTVIERHAASAFGGEVAIEFNPEGLRWKLVAPLSAFTSAGS